LQRLGLKKQLGRQVKNRQILMQFAACALTFLFVFQATNAYAWGFFSRKPKDLPNYFTQHQEEILASNPRDRAIIFG